MAINQVDYIWRNGALIPWADAQVHVLSHALHYGTSFFEGIRSYDTPAGPAVFRLTDHVKRLIDSARIYSIDLPYTAQELAEEAIPLAEAASFDPHLANATWVQFSNLYTSTSLTISAQAHMSGCCRHWPPRPDTRIKTKGLC